MNLVICHFYTTDGFPTFHPLCKIGHGAGLGCHSENNCPDYHPAWKTIVVNCKTSPYDVLIDRTTIFGNPFRVWQWGREGCINKFREYFYRRIEQDPEWRVKVLELKGKVVGCHCKPLPCHGDIYADFLNTYDQVENAKKEAGL